MPYCKVGKCKPKTVLSSLTPYDPVVDGNEVPPEACRDGESVTIFYKRYGHGPTKVLLIIGLAGTHVSWGPQIAGLAGTDKPHSDDETGKSPTAAGVFDSESSGDASKAQSGSSDGNGEREEQEGTGIEVCTFDNRGVGRSSIPIKRSDYTTTVMAQDALALLDHLGWDKVHVCGHSMGGMIGCKLATLAPHRLSSLSLVGVTGGGYQCVPRLNRASFSLAYRLYTAKTPEERSAVDLEFHFTDGYLESKVGDTTMREILFKDYTNNLLNNGMQSRYGLEGQASACWQHGISKKDAEIITSAGIIVAVIHGRLDVIAQIAHARTLAKKLRPVSRMIELPGGHLVTHENSPQVNGVLHGIIRAVKMNVKCTDIKASDLGLYDTPGGEYWQATRPGSDGGAGTHGLTGNSAAASDSILNSLWKRLLPEFAELLYISPFLQWISRIFGIDKMWEKLASVY